MKRLVVDIDNTLSWTRQGDYANAIPILPVIEKLRAYKRAGFIIALHTARNMRTFQGNVGAINAKTLPPLVAWLDAHQVPYDEIITGKPWNGDGGFYVDDSAVRPDEFAVLSLSEIETLLANAQTRLRDLSVTEAVS